jgi:UDP-3-O-[3-hydroxymyristoyl] glucosamine N-acyltransferase
MRAGELARLLDGRLEGEEVELSGVAPLETAGSGELAFLREPGRAGELLHTRAGAVLVPEDLTADEKVSTSLIRVKDPYAALRRVLEHFHPETAPEPGVHPTAVVAPGAELDPTVSVGPWAVVESGAQVGAGSVIGAGVFLGRGCSLGSDCRIHPGVVVYADSVIGDRVEILANAVIGSDGFGHSVEDGTFRKIPHVGRVVLEDDVLVGAGTTIDRATLGETRILAGTKLDNLVMVAHNCRLGPHSAVAAQAGFAGSTIVGAGVQIGGQAGFAGHLTVGDGAVVGAQSGVIKDVAPNTFVWGFPARLHKETLQTMANTARVPEVRRRLKEIEARVRMLEEGRSPERDSQRGE